MIIQFLAPRPHLRTVPGWSLRSGKGSSLLRYPRKLLWKTVTTPLDVRWLDDISVTIFPRSEMGQELFITGYYEPNQLYLLNRILKEENSFVDVGANMGLYTLFAAKRVGSHGLVIAIEPCSRDFERLRRNIELNSFINVKLEPYALSNREGFANLHVAWERNEGHNTLGTFAYEGVQEEKWEQVKVMTLDETIRREDLKRVDVIKIDVEGSELYVLEGADGTLNEFHPILLLELSDRTLGQQSCTSGQVWRFLTDRGYNIFEYDVKTGLPVPAERRQYYDSVNIVAVHNLSPEKNHI